MKPEIEATFTDIVKDQIRTQLTKIGAKLVQKETLMRRTIFDLEKLSYARVRDEGNRITMSYKHLDSLTIDGMKEVCINISNYEDGITLLKACGLKVKSVQESYREEWKLNDVEITIDTWPWIPSYIEIEGPNTKSVQQTANQLGFKMSEALYGGADEVYKIYFDITNDEINFYPEIRFTNIPDWLAQKRRKK